MTILKDMKTPVFKAEGIPDIDKEKFTLTVEANGKITILTLKDILSLPQTTMNLRLTSVSGFSVRADWNGVLWRDLLAKTGRPKDFNFVIFGSFGGYTANVYKEDILEDRWVVCHSVGGEELEPEYGGPLRMIIPNLWGYKSCKWLTTIRFVKENEPGFWETRGYTDRGLIEPGESLDINTRTKRPIKGGEVTEF